MVLVTHDIEEAAQLADRVIVLTERPAQIRCELTIHEPRPARADASGSRPGHRPPPDWNSASKRMEKEMLPVAVRQTTRRNEMFRSSAARWILGVIAFVAVISSAAIPSLGTPGWNRSRRDSEARETLTVGFLPVTCHLTCPVTDFATRTSATTRFVSQRFTDFPTIVESIKGGRLEASFMIAPLAMKLREQGMPVKILYLGHRDGSTVMVRKDLPAKDLRDLRGKTFAIPSKYSNQYLVIHKLMEDQGVKPDEIRFVELPPPDMPGALAAKAIDAYFVGEPYRRQGRVGRQRARAVLCQRHLAAFHFVRAGGAREADPGASRGCARPGARHCRERGVGGKAPPRAQPRWHRPTSGRMKRWCVLS